MRKNWPAIHKPPLTPAQMRIMACIDQGKGNLPIKKVAELLGKHPSTIHTQLRLINKRLGTEDWFQAYKLYHADPGALGEIVDEPLTSQEVLGRKWRGPSKLQ